MYAQLTSFDGPRSDQLVRASRRAGLERIEPALKADPYLRDQLIALLVLKQANGAEVVVTVLKSEQALHHAQKVIMSTELLPGEDPALLPGPDRVEIYDVIRSDFGSHLALSEEKS